MHSISSTRALFRFTYFFFTWPDCRCEIIAGDGPNAHGIAGEGMMVVPHPCANCDGTCVVCIGIATPGSISVHASGRMLASL